MEKIFDSCFRDELISKMKQAGLKDEEVLRIVNGRYKDAIKEAAINRLKEVIRLITEDKYSELSELIEYSPAGDGQGCDNYYISFADVTAFQDIGDIMMKLKTL